ncbi:lysozyme [Planomonospora sp. ID67723]|uniref:lysozyme n=1 Tax=Planomonospora sp. ID67723 TaxID=2738134 RepID=UPI001E5C540B|nr:lysozyme [Planomonospora sp. ID67723]
MKRLSGLLLGGLVLASVPFVAVPGTVLAASAPADVRGLDVSSYQPSVSWTSVYGAGGRFAYVKATESVTYRNPYFAAQSEGARRAGLIRGAYHFALPHKSGGAAQADYFVRYGGGWTGDGRTLPGALDIEFNPYRSSNGLNTCYGLSPAQMTGWIRDFSNRYLALTGRRPVIYTNTYWWQTCTGGSAAFGDHPLWIARYSSSAGTLPSGWTRHAIWQYADSGVFPGDQNAFNGTYEQLRQLAAGQSAAAPVKSPATSPTKNTAKSTARATTRVSFVNAGPDPIRRGRKLTVVGTLSQYTASGTRQAAAKQKIAVMFRPHGSATWRTAGTVTTAADGTFRTAIKASKDGTWQVVYKGDSRRLGAKSRTDYVDVR